MDNNRSILIEHFVLLSKSIIVFVAKKIADTDIGWTITLGRGLDIFEKYSPFSIETFRQDKRKCKEFMVIMKDKNV